MRDALLVSGVLGLGTVLVFAAAAMTATLFPSGTMVSGGWGGGWGKDGPAPMMAPAVMPAIEDGGPVFTGPDGKSLR